MADREGLAWSPLRIIWACWWGCFWLTNWFRPIYVAFRAVWWQGLIITLPAVFVAVIPVLWIANTPEWLQDLTFWLAFPDIIMTFERVRREQKAADVSHS